MKSIDSALINEIKSAMKRSTGVCVVKKRFRSRTDIGTKDYCLQTPHQHQSSRKTADKIKTKLFRKLVFMKAKPEEVQLVSIKRYFEPYVIVDGEYGIDYSNNWVHNIQVDDTTQELTLFGKKVQPKTLKDTLQISAKSCN